ncbi:MAG: hypothetical protein KAS78_02755, partial [Candidatus Pacebacteria bacterium]|nr:hypothetical protein [Candidatus Paceibacterota bacterium]
GIKRESTKKDDYEETDEKNNISEVKSEGKEEKPEEPFKKTELEDTESIQKPQVKNEESKTTEIAIRKKTEEIEPFIKELKAYSDSNNGFEKLIVNELKDKMERIRMYFDEMFLRDIKDKALEATIIDQKTKLGKYNREMKSVLRLKRREEEKQKKSKHPQEEGIEKDDNTKENISPEPREKTKKETESVDDFLQRCKNEEILLRISDGEEQIFLIASSLAGIKKGGTVELKNTGTGKLKMATRNKEFLYELNNVKISREDLVNLEKNLEENRSLFDGNELNPYAIEGTVNDLLNKNEGVEKIDISDYSAVIRALEIVEKNEELKVEGGVEAGKEYVSGALPAIFEKLLESTVSEAEIRDIEEQIKRYEDILNQLKNELESRDDDGFENRKETESFIDKLESLIVLMSELLELKKQGNQKKEITIKESEIDNLTSELKEIIKKLNKKNDVLRGEGKKELNTGGEEEIEEISDLGWNIDKLFDGKKDLGADDEKMKEDMLKDIPNAVDFIEKLGKKSKEEKIELENWDKLNSFMAENFSRTEEAYERSDDRDEFIDDLLVKYNLETNKNNIEKLKDILDGGVSVLEDAEQKAELFKKLTEEYEKAEEDNDQEEMGKIAEKIRVLETKTAIEYETRTEDAEKEPEKIELNEAEKEYIRKTKEIEKLRKENEGLLSILWEDLTEEEKEIVERIEELEIGRVVDKGSAIMTNHIDELERKVGTPKEKKGILEAQKEYIESKKLLIGVEMLEKGLRMKMERSKKRRSIFPSVGKFGNAVKNAVKGRLKDPFKKEEKGKTAKTISETNKRFSREKRKDLNSMSKQELTDEFEKVLGDIIDLAAASNKKTKEIIKNVYKVNIEKVLKKINSRDDIKNDHDDIKENFEEIRRRIGELPNDLSNPKEYLNKMISKVEDIFKEKIGEGADLNYDDYEIIVKPSGELVAWNPKDGDPGVRGSQPKKSFFYNSSEIIKKLLEQEKKVDLLDIIFSKDEISRVKNAQNIESLMKIIDSHKLKFDWYKDSNATAKHYHECLYGLSNCYDSNKKEIDSDKLHKLDNKMFVLGENYNENASNYFMAVLERLDLRENNKKGRNERVKEITENMQSRMRVGLEELKKDNINKFEIVGSVFFQNNYPSSEKLCGEDFSDDLSVIAIEYLNIKLDEIKDIKTKDFVAVVKKVYNKVKEE